MKFSSLLLISVLVCLVWRVNAQSYSVYHTDSASHQLEPSELSLPSTGSFLSYSLAHSTHKSLPVPDAPVRPSSSAISNLRVSEITVKPAEVVNYKWNVSINDWQKVEKLIYHYNNKGIVSEIVRQLPLEGDNYIANRKMISSYDSLDRFVQLLYQRWDGTQWQDSSRVQYVYDEKGFITEFTYQLKENDIWAIQSGDKYIYTFDASNRLESFTTQAYSANNFHDKYKETYAYEGTSDNINQVIKQSFENGVWKNTLRNDYLIDSEGNWTQKTSYYWNSSSWTPYFRTKDVLWHDFATRQMTSFIEQDWMSNHWMDRSKYAKTYDANGGSVLTKDTMTTTWVSKEKTAILYNENKDYTGYTYHIWQNNAWLLLNEEKGNYTYTNNFAEEIIWQTYNKANNSYENKTKSVSSPYITSSIERKHIAVKEFALYPVPARESASVIFNLIKPSAALSLKIVDLSGKVLKSIENTNLKAGSHDYHFETKDMVPGLYIVQLITDGHTESKKLIIK